MPNSFEVIRDEIYWRKALSKSVTATKVGSLVPIETRILKNYKKSNIQFEVRYMFDKSQLRITKDVPIENPFQPWDKDLEIAPIGPHHTLILNKYPVQVGHMLLITNNWAPQQGWLSLEDWKALEHVDQDTCGLWFFNSGPSAGASQPHRHIQLLRRRYSEIYCPRDSWFEDILNQKDKKESLLGESISVIEREYDDDANILYKKYLKTCMSLDIGSPELDKIPRLPYNLLISKKWMAGVRRSKESTKGFNINALGFAGYLLATKESELTWLELNGLEELLSLVIG